MSLSARNGPAFAYPSTPALRAALRLFEARERRRELAVQREKERNYRLGKTIVKRTFTVSNHPRAVNYLTVKGGDEMTGDGDALSSYLRRAFGPEGLKHLAGLLIGLYRSSEEDSLLFDVKDHLDLLGYARQQKPSGHYHHPRNVKDARRIVGILSSLTVHQGGPGEEVQQDVRICSPADPDVVDSGGTFALPRTCRLHVNPDLFRLPGSSEVEPGDHPFTRQREAIATENARQHGITLLLGLLLPVTWRLNTGPVSVRASNLMEWAHLDPAGRKRRRRLRRLQDELDYMVQRGYLGSWEENEDQDEDDPLDRVVKLSPPHWLQGILEDIRDSGQQKEVAGSDEGDGKPEDEGSRLRQRRKAKGLTQKQVAEQLGISRSTVAMVEAGKRQLPDSAGKGILADV